MSVLSACVQVHSCCAMSRRLRRGHQIPLEPELWMLVSHHVSSGDENIRETRHMGPLQEQAVLLSAEQFLQPTNDHRHAIYFVMYFYIVDQKY